ncbi:hypothetical protein J2Z40_003516 [Cytobacillus eiseniae]|uniref:DUF4179 domain-containing protein n=1 Tax=Cytobacillus eiseniae TaxID=762947 RepID=A0ABS4RJ47_9BACI|nr:DUF4179 domain-containing protein [Cytobacillus eiseniae]MBP2242934.1 hypothetical protein [Cytobacillus eiseniae]
MIPEKIDSNRLTADLSMSLESIIDWFDQNKESFYILGSSYLKNQEQMEELFYHVIIKIQKELPRLKRESSLEVWVASLFIHICRELSAKRSEESERRLDVFKILDQMKEKEKEAIILTYGIGFSLEEGAEILQASVEEMKKFLFTGIQSLREQLGDGIPFDGCKENHSLYIDYLGRTLDRSKKVDFEIHIYHCRSCQEDLAIFQEVMLKLPELFEEVHMPAAFMAKVKERLVEKEERRQLRGKKQKKIGLIFASVFALFIFAGFLTGWFSKLYYSWTEEDPELRQLLQHDYGERLDLVAENNGVKVTIKSAIADDVQTLIFYEIEDMKEENQYVMNFQEGAWVENESDIMDNTTYPKYYLPTQHDDAKNVYHGKMSLLPLTEENATIELNVTKLQKLVYDPSRPDGYRVYEGSEYEKGEWKFEIPVTKYASVEYEIDEEIEIEGIPIYFNKFTIAPTATLLQYAILNEQFEKRIDYVNFDSIEVNGKKLEIDPYSMGNGYQAQFPPLFEKNPKEVLVRFGSILLSVNEHQSIELDHSKGYPQSFEYAGSTISIDSLEIGRPSNMVLSDHQTKNRPYDSFHVQVIDENENAMITYVTGAEYMLVDKSGKEYDLNRGNIQYETLEWPRYLTTVQNIEMQNENFEEKVIPKSLEIFGYNTTKYVDDAVEIKLD